MVKGWRFGGLNFWGFFFSETFTKYVFDGSVETCFYGLPCNIPEMLTIIKLH